MDKVLILEDDVQFCDNFDGKLSEVLKRTPEDWDMILLNGTTTTKLQPVNQFVSKTDKTWGAFGYILHSRIYDRVITEFEKGDDRSDGYFTKMQKDINAYKTNEKLVLHKKGYSYIAGFETDHKHLR